MPESTSKFDAAQFCQAVWAATAIPSPRILLLDFGLNRANCLPKSLTEQGFDVTHVSGLDSGFCKTQGNFARLVVIDAPQFDSGLLRACRELRAQSNTVAIVFVNAPSSLAYRVLCFEAGADEYFERSISTIELSARIRALLRRNANMQISPRRLEATLSVGAITINMIAREVVLDGSSIELTQKEFDLLSFFARRPNVVFTRPRILEEIWGKDYDGYDHTVTSHINRLRGKIERDAARPRIIITARGIGYKLVDDGWRCASYAIDP